MTDQPPLTDDDLSLALDGEADADLLARIDADPAAQARLEELRAAADRLAGATVPSLDAAVVDDLIAAAIDTPLAPAAPRTRRGQRRATPWLVAASVVLLMAVGLSLVWAGRGTDDDQASATKSAMDEVAGQASSAEADSSFSESDGRASSNTEDGADSGAGGHGSATTVAAPSASTDLPLLYLGTYDSGDDLRTATAASLTDAWEQSGSELAFDTGDDTGDASGETGSKAGTGMPTPPSEASVDRCGEQLQITLSTKSAAVQTGYAVVDGKDVLVYEFATASAQDPDRETTLVAAVGADACDEVVFFER